MESSHGVEPDILFSCQEGGGGYEQYSSELCVFSHKSESVSSLWRGRFMSCEIVCKLTLENDPRDMVLMI